MVTTVTTTFPLLQNAGWFVFLFSASKAVAATMLQNLKGGAILGFFVGTGHPQTMGVESLK